MERTGCIYMATVNADLSKCYVGRTLNFEKRKQAHLHVKKDTLFSRAIWKYGADAVSWQILEDDVPEHRLNNREELWISWYDTFHNGLNMTGGGEVNPMSNPEIAAKVSKTLRKMAHRGEHPMQQPEIAAKQRNTQLAIAARGDHYMQTPANAKAHSDYMKSLAIRGELHVQQPKERQRRSEYLHTLIDAGISPMHSPEAQERSAATQREKGRQGTHQSQQPDNKAKNAAGQHRRIARENMEAWSLAGQQFLCDMSLDTGDSNGSD